jgi:hypothetical protein
LIVEDFNPWRFQTNESAGRQRPYRKPWLSLPSARNQTMISQDHMRVAIFLDSDVPDHLIRFSYSVRAAEMYDTIIFELLNQVSPPPPAKLVAPIQRERL